MHNEDAGKLRIPVSLYHSHPGLAVTAQIIALQAAHVQAVQAVDMQAVQAAVVQMFHTAGVQMLHAAVSPHACHAQKSVRM